MGPNVVIARSRFWYFLSKYHQMKKRTMVLSLDMTVALVPIIFTKNSVIPPEQVLSTNFIWIWLEDTEQEQEASKLLLLRIANAHTSLNSTIQTLNSLSLTEFNDQANNDTNADSDHKDLTLFGKLYFLLKFTSRINRKLF